MAKQLKLRRGTTSQHSSFTGAEGECTVDTTKDTLVVHDGSQAGGRPLLREDLNNIGTGVITAAMLGSNSVDSSELVADCVTGAKIADNAINSEHYTDGSIDHVHLANDCIDGDNISDDAINSEHYVNASIDRAHIANNAIGQNQIEDGEVIGSKIAANAVNEARLQISNTPTNGYVLTAQSGNTGGLTWAEQSAAGATGGGSDTVFWENGQTVTTNYTITNNTNAGTFGPITINSGITVTVGAGETWTVI